MEKIIMDEKIKSNFDIIYHDFDTFKTIDDSCCLHNSCPECNGSGIKEDGSMCIHNISCNCDKCSCKY